MTDILSLDEGYSTTRLLTQEKPQIINTPEDKFETVLFLPEGENRKGEGGLRTKGYFKKSFDDKPLISIITVVFNGEKYLEETIQSVINQTYSNVEYIIIDGGSTDGTIDIIKKYEDKLAYWISEKDSGIYDAMNKGIQKTNGDYVGLINSDDWYELDAIEKVVVAVLNNKSVDIIYGDMNIVDVDSNKNKLLFGDINSLNRNMSINHPTCFVKNKLYKERLFDTNYKIAADYDLMLYFRFNKKIFFHIDKVLANMRGGGVSTNNNKTIQERFMIHKKYYSIKHAYINLWSFKSKVLIRDILTIVLPVKLLNRIKGYK